MSVSKEEIRAARTADLYDFLLRMHPDEFKREGHWLRMKSQPGLCLKKGCGGYKDYATLETGNSIDFLLRYMRYSFVDAVSALSSENLSTPRNDPAVRDIVFPERSPQDAAMRQYLSGRGFPDETMDQLESAGLLYQDIHRNAVFRSAKADFYESRGTWPGKPFHQCGKKTPDSFWSFCPEGPPKRAYICEGAIDAVSLCLIHSRKGMAENNAYCGIAGVANQQTIERIRVWLPAVLAVDNDAAGEQCRNRNSGIPSMIPRGKDWNEDLISHSY